MNPSHHQIPNFIGADRQTCPSSDASSTRHILSSPTGSSSNNDSQQHSHLRSQHRPMVDYVSQHSRRTLQPIKSTAFNTSSHGAGITTTGQVLSGSHSMNAVPSAVLAHNGCDSESSEISMRSVPQPDARSDFSSSGSRTSQRANHRAEKHTHRLDFEHGYLKISAPMVDEIIRYRRSLLLLILTFLYALFGLGAIFFKSSSPISLNSYGEASKHDEWTQEMIFGWYQDRPLSITGDYTSNNKSDGRHFRARECRSRMLQHQHQLELATSSSDEDNSRKKKNQTTDRPNSRHRRKFEALNGCLFRREVTSESLGDLCCCAGIPKFVLIESNNTKTVGQASNSTKTTTRSPASNVTTITPANSTGTIQKTTRRKYLRPQLMCFVSAASNLFNSQKLVAPIANEQNIKSTFVKNKGGKCIPCSCCHEHDPEKVNKLLANVPLYKSKSKSMMIDKNGNQLVTPARGDADEGESNSGFWVRIRDHLTNWMRSIDDFFFSVYDLFDLLVLRARYGSLPPDNYTDSSGLLLVQSTLVRPPTLNEPNLKPSTNLKHPKVIEQLNLLIDEDAYIDFTTTTTTTTTTSTTTTTTTTTTTSTTTSTTAKPTRVKSNRMRTNSTSRRINKISRRKRPKFRSTTTTLKPNKTLIPAVKLASLIGNSTTKSPTVIINVYAGNSAPTAPSMMANPPSTTPASTTIITTTYTPQNSTPMVIAASNGEQSTTNDGGDIELRIKLKDSNMTKLDRSPVVPSLTIKDTTITSMPTRIINITNDTSHAPQSIQLSGTGGSLSSIMNILSPQSQQEQNQPQQQQHEHQIKIQQGNSSKLAVPKSSIVISLGQGNATTIIATINTTRLGIGGDSIRANSASSTPSITTKLPASSAASSSDTIKPNATNIAPVVNDMLSLNQTVALIELPAETAPPPTKLIPQLPDTVQKELHSGGSSDEPMLSVLPNPTVMGDDVAPTLLPPSGRLNNFKFALVPSMQTMYAKPQVVSSGPIKQHELDGYSPTYTTTTSPVATDFSPQPEPPIPSRFPSVTTGLLSTTEFDGQKVSELNAGSIMQIQQEMLPRTRK